MEAIGLKEQAADDDTSKILMFFARLDPESRDFSSLPGIDVVVFTGFSPMKDDNSSALGEINCGRRIGPVGIDA